jgi:hypothetical protein
MREWITWSFLAAVIVVGAAYYYADSTWTPANVYKIVVTPNSP